MRFLSKKIFSFYIITCIFQLYANQYTSKHTELIRLGTDYGGWTIPKDFINENSIVYCAGVGEDISFDIELIKKFNCHVYSIDPTPRSSDHIQYIIEQVSNNKKAYINNGSLTYGLHVSLLDHLHYIPVGLWNENKIMKFYSPKNNNHVSHSILNLQKTNDYFEAPCKKISTLMQELGHTHIDLLKLDIEGAEYAVLDSIIEDAIEVRCLCVEFDEFAGVNKICNKNIKASLKRANQRIDMLVKHGYTILYKKDLTDITFLKTN